MSAILLTEQAINTPPPLENGDCLNRSEFERRYQAMPNVKKAELIEGIVYMASPLRFDVHAEPHANLMIWLGSYKIAVEGVRLGDNPTVRLDRDNEPQPDAVLFWDTQFGGQCVIGEEGYIEGSPELVAEIAASTATIDLRDKKRVYRRNGVKEYIVWSVCDRKFNWFILENEEYRTLTPDNGILQSRYFPGLWLNLNALLTGNMSQVMQTLQEGLKGQNSSMRNPFS